MKRAEEKKENCHFCGLPLGDEYTVYKGMNFHQTCFHVFDGKLEPSSLAEDLKLVSEALEKQNNMSLNELFDLLWATKQYATESSCKLRVRHLMRDMCDMGVVEEAKAERTIIREVKVWRKIGIKRG